MGKPRRPRSLRPAQAPNAPFAQDPDTGTAIPAAATDAPETALPPEPPAEAEPVPALEAAIEAATAPLAADTVLHRAAADPAREAVAEAAPQEPAADAPAPQAVVAAEEPIADAASTRTETPEPAIPATVPVPAAETEPVAAQAAPALPEIPEPVAPEPVAPEPVVPEPIAPEAVARMAVAAATPFARRGKAEFQFVFMPEPPDFSGIYAAIARYMRDESAAAAAHMRALGEARSPADLIRLQVGEFQRAADASLTCWSAVAHKAGYSFR